jgi:ABC-2 type transport system ATP-binding protein
VPRLFDELGVGITSVAVSRPTLDDVFMRYTGSTIRDAETASVSDLSRATMRVLSGAGR